MYLPAVTHREADLAAGKVESGGLLTAVGQLMICAGIVNEQDLYEVCQNQTVTEEGSPNEKTA